MHVGTQHFSSAFGEAEAEGLGAGGSDAAVTKEFPFLPGSRSAHVSLSPASVPGCQEAPDEPAEQSRAGEDPALRPRPDGPQGGPGGGLRGMETAQRYGAVPRVGVCHQQPLLPIPNSSADSWAGGCVSRKTFFIKRSAAAAAALLLPRFDPVPQRSSVHQMRADPRKSQSLQKC